MLHLRFPRDILHLICPADLLSASPVFPSKKASPLGEMPFFFTDYTSLLKSPQRLKSSSTVSSVEIRLVLTASSSTITMTLSR